MYLAEYSIGDGRWVQGALRLIWPVETPDDAAARWSRRVRAVLDNLTSLPHAAASLRVRLADRLIGSLFACAPESSASTLQRMLDPLTAADGTGAVAAACRDRASHDDLLEFPRFRTLLALPRLTHGDAWFAFDFRLHGSLEELLLEAHAQGHAIAYHLNAEQVTLRPEWLRDASRNALRVADTPGIPDSLEALQQQLCTRLRTATHITEELLGVESPEAWVWLHDTLCRRFHERFGASVQPEFRFVEDDHDGSLIATRHRGFFEPLAVDELCSAAVVEEEVLGMLAWSPGPELGRLIAVRELAPTAVASPEADPGMPPSYEGEQAYVFISYKREDLSRIAPIVRMLHQRGHRVWYDRAIPGGAEWDSVIERRVRGCHLVVLFLTQAAVESKYIRREVKFADSMNRPILAVHLDDAVQLTHGLGMLLSPYQMIDGRSNTLGTEIERALRALQTGGITPW